MEIEGKSLTDRLYLKASRGLQLHSLWIIPTVAVS